MAEAVHTMVGVLDLDRSVSFCREAFGLEEADRVDSDDFAPVYPSNAENDFEVGPTLNKGETEPFDLGNGHLAVSVDGLEAEHGRFVEAGFGPRDVVELKRDGSAVGEFFSGPGRVPDRSPPAGWPLPPMTPLLRKRGTNCPTVRRGEA